VDSLSVDVLLRNPNISKVLSLGYQPSLVQIQKFYFLLKEGKFCWCMLWAGKLVLGFFL
jgi:hypothetical protein